MAGYKKESKRAILEKEARRAAAQVVQDRRKDGTLDEEDEREMYDILVADYKRRHS